MVFFRWRFWHGKFGCFISDIRGKRNRCDSIDVKIIDATDSRPLVEWVFVYVFCFICLSSTQTNFAHVNYKWISWSSNITCITPQTSLNAKLAWEFSHEFRVNSASHEPYVKFSHKFHMYFTKNESIFFIY